MLPPFQFTACGLNSPKGLLPCLPPQLPAPPGLWATGQGLNWPLPRTRAPEALCTCAYSLHTPNKHQTSLCLPLSFFSTEKGEGVRGTWQSSKGPRSLFTPVDLQLEGLRGWGWGGLVWGDKLPHPPTSQRLLFFSHPGLGRPGEAFFPSLHEWELPPLWRGGGD